MKQHRFYILLPLLVVFLVQTVSADSPVYARLVVPLFFESEIPKDADLICERASKIVEERIGASIQLVPLLYLYGPADPLRVAELEMMAKQGINLDIFPSVIRDFMTPIALDSLLDQYGQDILPLIGEFRLSFARANGPIYQLDSMNDYVSSVGIAIRKDIVEKYDIDLSTIHSLYDLDALFAWIAPREPELRMIAPYQSSYTLLSRYKQTMAAPSTILAVSSEDASRLENYYATDAYRESLALVRKWYKAGYLPQHLVLQSIRSSQRVSAGELLSYICAYKPGIDFEETQSSGMPMVTVSLRDPVVTRRSLTTTKWSISSTCANPGKAMMLLNLLYTDSDLVNLLMYGIEGMHYAIRDDGTIDYPEGVTVETVGYKNTLSWILPNQTVAHVWYGNDPDLWEKLVAHNESAPLSDTLYFAFDESGLESEIATVNAVVAKYAFGLETGQLDPDIYLPMMLLEMEAAGAAKIVEEGQAQFDRFLEEKGGAK